MPEAIRKVNVIGHLHPDTDSICSAIALAYLKNQIDKPIYEARRAGALNRETSFVLRHFGFDEPELITTVTPQIKDLRITKDEGVGSGTSLFSAWNAMRDRGTATLSVVDGKTLEGVISIRDIANANLDIFDTEVLATSRTSHANIASTLDGTIEVGSPDDDVTSGKMCVGSTPEMMEGVVEKGDVVLCTNRYETQQFAVDCGAQVLVICCGAKAGEQVTASATEHGCTIISTPHDTYAAARLLSMSVPVRAKMRSAADTEHFSVNTSVDAARKTMAGSQHRAYPVLDEDGNYVGVVTSANMLDVTPKHVILVDHNERSQAVEGLEQAEIMEIVDHHRIGSIETAGPVVFRNEPVGCTATILYGMFRENGVEIPAGIAGLMMSAILSDTLCFRSPTCTDRDVRAGRALAEICGEDVESYADAMFDAGADLTGRTAEDVFNSDFKVFSRGKARFGVGQSSFMTENSRKAAEGLVGPYLEAGAAANELPMVFYLFTDVKTQTSEVLYWGEGAEEVIERAFGVKPVDGMAVLPGIVSRKKQVTPPIMTILQDGDE